MSHAVQPPRGALAQAGQAAPAAGAGPYGPQGVAPRAMTPNTDPAAFAATAPPPTTDEYMAALKQAGNQATPGGQPSPGGAPPAGLAQPQAQPYAPAPAGPTPAASPGLTPAGTPPVEPTPANRAPEVPVGPNPELSDLAPTAISGERTSASPKHARVLAGFLVSYEGHAEGAFWPIYEGQNIVGRKDAAQGLDVQIDHPTTSSRHAMVNAQARPGRLEVVDTGSTNGTFYGEGKIEPGRAVALRDGDQLRFGGFPVIVKII